MGDERGRRNPAGDGANGNALLRGLPKGLGKGGMCALIGADAGDVFHLYNKQQHGVMACLHGANQFPDMLYAPQGGRVRKVCDAVFLQRDAFYLNVSAFLRRLGGKINPGFAQGNFAAQNSARKQQWQIFLGYMVGRLAVHVDQAFSLVYGDQIVLGLAGGVFGFFQNNGCAGKEKFPTAPGVFDMADMLGALQGNQGDEPVRSGEKDALNSVFVLHECIIAFFPQKRKGKKTCRNGERTVAKNAFIV